MKSKEVKRLRENLSKSRKRAEELRTRLLVFLSFMNNMEGGGMKDKVIADIREQLQEVDNIISDIKLVELEVEEEFKG